MMPEATCAGAQCGACGGGMLDELVQLLVQLPGLVVHRNQVGVPSRVLEIMGDGGPCEGIEPVVLREGALSTDRAQYLVEQAVEGTPFAINVFGAVEVLLDQRRTYEQTMLVHHRLEDVDNPLIVGNGAPVCVLHTKLVWVLLDGRNEKVRKHGAAVVGLAQDRLDYLLLGNRYQRLERVVVIAARETARGYKQHPAVKKFQHRVGRLGLSPS